MKHFVRILSLALAMLALCACGAGDVDDTTVAPTTTAAPTETQNIYPEPDKIIALTFDDGPNSHMEAMLDIFAEYDGKATFFLIGKKVDASTSAIIKRAFDEGHEIANHSQSHTDLTQMTADEVAADVETLQAAVEEITGQRPVWFRAPFLRANDIMYSVIDMPFAGCSVSAGDGSNDNLAEDRHYRVVSGASDGGIVLLHCTDITAEVLPQILHDLKMQGYEFVTISELFARKGVTPDTEATFQYKETSTTN